MNKQLKKTEHESVEKHKKCYRLVQEYTRKTCPLPFSILRVSLVYQRIPT